MSINAIKAQISKQGFDVRRNYKADYIYPTGDCEARYMIIDENNVILPGCEAMSESDL